MDKDSQDKKNSLRIHGDNHGPINLRVPGRALVAAACLAALLLAAAGLIGCWLFATTPKPKPRVITPVEERVIQEGPYGGKFYINRSGRKSYVARDTPTAEPQPEAELQAQK